jgi:protein TonB
LLKAYFSNTNLKSNYRRTFEASLMIVLLSFVLVFQAFKRFDIRTDQVEQIVTPLIVEQVPITRSATRPLPPIRPRVPIPSDGPDIPDDLSISETELVFDDELPPPPSLPEIDLPSFEAFDSEPEPVGGLEAIREHLFYPEYARRAGIQGQVTIRALIDKEGNVADWEFLKSLGNTGCDEVALTALRRTQWKPAIRNMRPVEDWVTIPFIFKLVHDR